MTGKDPTRTGRRRRAEGVVELFVYRGDEHSRVLAPLESSPTGYTSMTGAFPTPQQAVAVMLGGVMEGAFPWENTTLRFRDLRTNEVLREERLPGREEKP